MDLEAHHHPARWHDQLLAAFSAHASLASVPSTVNHLVITARPGDASADEAHLVIDRSEDGYFRWDEAGAQAVIHSQYINWMLSNASGSRPAVLKLPHPCPADITIRWDNSAIPLNIDGQPYKDLGGVLPSLIVTTQDAPVNVSHVKATTVAIHVHKTGPGSHQMAVAVPNSHGDRRTTEVTASLGKIDAVHLLIENNAAIESDRSSDDYAIHECSVTFFHFADRGYKRMIELIMNSVRLYGPAEIRVAKGHINFDVVGQHAQLREQMENQLEHRRVEEGSFAIFLGDVLAELTLLQTHLPITVHATGDSIVDLHTPSSSGTLQVMHDLGIPPGSTSKTKEGFSAKVRLWEATVKRLDITTHACPVSVYRLITQTGAKIRTGIDGRPAGVNSRLGFGRIDCKRLTMGNPAAPQDYHLEAAEGGLEAKFDDWSDQRSVTVTLMALLKVKYSGQPSSAVITQLEAAGDDSLKSRIKIETRSPFIPGARHI